MNRIFNILNTGDPEGEDALDFIDMQKDTKKKKKKKVKSTKVEPVIKIPDDYQPAPHPNLLKTPFSLLLVSKKGSGKTTTIHNLLVWYKNYFDKIFIFSPTINMDLKWGKLIDKLHIPPEHLFTSASERKVGGLMNSIKDYNGRQEKNKDKLKVLFVFDDIVESLPKSKKISFINKLAMNHRHYNISHMIVSQGFKKLDPVVRSNTTGMILYNTDNTAERMKIVEELAGNLGRMQFEKLWLDCVREKYGFLFINYDNRKVYKNFEKEIADLDCQPQYLYNKMDRLGLNKSKSNLKEEKNEDKIENTEE